MSYMPISIHRRPDSGGSHFKEKTFEGRLVAVTKTRPGREYIELRFSTNPEGANKSHFSSGIGPEQFSELAQLMMAVDPASAIKAFGAAMQGVPEIPKPVV